MVELKAKEALTGADEGQLINYLKATGIIACPFVVAAGG